jgi:hypothetical protein
MSYWIAIACSMVVELYVLRRLRFDGWVVAMVLAATLVDANYLGYTQVYERNYDAPSHLLYIDALAQHLRMPTETLCTACGHPPLYHALAALWSRVVLVGGWIPHETGLQWFSQWLFFGFVVFSLLILRSTVERPATLRLAVALIVFWPSSILNSVRVHNDALVSMLMIAAMYFMAQWDRQGRRRDFYAAVAACALALLTKSAGYTVVVALLALAAWRLWSTRFARASTTQLVVATLVLLGAAVLAVALRGPVSPSPLCGKVLGHACDVPPFSYVENRPLNYLSFDLRGFLGDPSSLASPPRQDYFLSTLAKSSLFGVMPLGKDFAGAPYRSLAVLLGLLLLVMVAMCAVVLPFIRRSIEWPKYRALIVATASMLTLLVAFRILLPTPFHGDFRHIYPALVPFCLLYAKAVESLGRWSKALHWGGVAIGVLMVAASVAFFVRAP